MTQLIIELPQSLHAQIEQIAEEEGVSVRQYALYVLAQQVVRRENFERRDPTLILKERNEMESRIASFSVLSGEQFDAILSDNEEAPSPLDVSAELLNEVERKIQDARKLRS